MIRVPTAIPNLRTPRHTLAGVGALEGLRGVPCSSVLIVSGRSVSAEMLDRVKKTLRSDACRHLVRSDGTPTLTAVRGLAEALGPFCPDCVVAIGGGATLDTAKLLMLFLEAPDIDTEARAWRRALPPLKARHKFVAIPTTAGSGSEASSAAVYADETGSPVPVVSDDFIPDVCVLDPRFLANIPNPVMASSILDAVVHCVESYVSIVSNPLAASLAEKALQMIQDTAPAYVQNPDSPTHVLNLQIAAYWAGIAQNHCGVGACHALAHQFARYGISHGVANGLFLGPVMALNEQEARVGDRLRHLSATAGVPSLSGLVRQIQRIGELPPDLKALGPVDRFDLAATAESATADVCARFNPRRFTKADFLTVLEASLA